MVLFVFACFRGVNVYEAFVCGAKESVKICVSLLPYLVAIFLLTELFDRSGLSDGLNRLLRPIWSFLGIPTEVGRLILIKPFSGSGSLAVLEDIYVRYGADGYVARCASVIFGSSETVFYVSAVYYARCKNKKLTRGIICSLLASFASCIVACLIVKIM